MKFWMKLFSRCGLPLLIAFPILINSQFFFHLYAHQKVTSGTRIIHGGDFTLKSAEGPLSLKDLRGKVVLLFFGYTSCADVCPISLATIAYTFSKLTRVELKRIRSLFISLDPEKDKLEILKQYTDYFHPNIVGLTDDIKTLTKVAKQYGVKYKKTLVPDSALGYVISHSDDIFVVGPDGNPQKTFPHDTNTVPLLAQIKRLLVVN